MFRERVLAAIALSGAIVAASAIVLETLPDGTVLVFGLGDGGIVREAYPYFSLVPYGFGNFGPFLAAILTWYFGIINGSQRCGFIFPVGLSFVH